jgi:RNA polymerase-interacting CarD/CdnL/TRCF family regulator
MKTRKEVEKLKSDWESDPIWNLHETEEFEEYYDELKKFQEEKETMWKKIQEEEEKEFDKKALKLGIEGLYRKILRQEIEIDRLKRAIDSLNNYKAYKIMMGYEE